MAYQCTKCNCNTIIDRNVVLLPEAVCKLVNVVLTLEWYCVPVYQVS